jgi:ActR/RegA family two-component response regulator
MATMKPRRSTSAQSSESTFKEIHRRLVAIHYPLAEATSVDLNLHRRTLQRLMDLLEYIEPLLKEEEAQMNAEAPTASPT